MCVRCQLDVAVRRIPTYVSDAIHTEHEATFATSRYKSACKGTTFYKSGNHFLCFFDTF